MRSLPVLLLVALALGLQAGCKKTDGISRDLGAACQSHADCSDRCLPSPRWPQGFCSKDCTGSSDCPVGSECMATVDGEVCLFACFDDGDCGFLEGAAGNAWRCRQLDGPSGTRQVCAPSLPVDAGVGGAG